MRWWSDVLETINWRKLCKLLTVELRPIVNSDNLRNPLLAEYLLQLENDSGAGTFRGQAPDKRKFGIVIRHEQVLGSLWVEEVRANGVPCARRYVWRNHRLLVLLGQRLLAYTACLDHLLDVVINPRPVDGGVCMKSSLLHALVSKMKLRQNSWANLARDDDPSSFGYNAVVDGQLVPKIPIRQQLQYSVYIWPWLWPADIDDFLQAP